MPCQGSMHYTYTHTHTRARARVLRPSYRYSSMVRLGFSTVSKPYTYIAY